MTEQMYSTDGPTCPHCRVMLTPDEGYYFDEGGYREQECPGCGKVYAVEVFTQTSWTTRIKDGG